ncbi:hypothetical protein H0H93_002857, partial [Arthromyces matolae]
MFVWADSGERIPFYPNGLRGAVEERFGPPPMLPNPAPAQPALPQQPQVQPQLPVQAPAAGGNFIQIVPRVQSHAVVQEIVEEIEEARIEEVVEETEEEVEMESVGERLRKVEVEDEDED